MGSLLVISATYLVLN